MAANFLFDEFKKFILDAVIVGVVSCVDSTLKKWIVLDMFKPGYLCLEGNFTRRLPNSELNWISHHFQIIWIYLNRVHFVHEKHPYLVRCAVRHLKGSIVEGYIQGTQMSW